MQAVTFALLLLAAVPALQPFYTPDDKTLDQNLTGVWRAGENVWQIARAPERTDYTLTVNQGLGGSYTATLFRIGSNTYLDLTPQLSTLIKDEFLALHALPAHTLMRVWIEGDSLRIAPMDNERLSTMLAQQPELLSHVSMERYGVKPQLVLTASTAQLRSFVQNQGDRIFAPPMTMRREAFGPAPAPVTSDETPGPLLNAPLTGASLNSAQAALRAARVANDEAEKEFGVRPFTPRMWAPRMDGGRWYWGNRDDIGPTGYSTEVSMSRDGKEVNVKVFHLKSESTETSTVESPATPPPPAPIVPR